MISSVNWRRRRGAVQALLFLALCAVAPGPSSLAAGTGEQAVPEVRLLCFAPSPYTQRHDSLRAGFGIMLSLQQLIQEHKLPLRVTYYDGIPALENRAKAGTLLRGAQVLVVGSATWAQGSSYYLRRYLEFTGAESLLGIPATAWATAGGFHTGGEMVIADTLRSLMGMGAEVFSLGQKYMVFTTDERIEPSTGGTPGMFSLLDCWYMEEFAKSIAVVALSGHNHAKAQELAGQLGMKTEYWRGMPRDEAVLVPRYGELRDKLNAAASSRSEAYRELRKLLSPYP